MDLFNDEISGIWAVDPVHSTIRFEAGYLVIGTVSGWFRDFEGIITTGKDGFDGSTVRLAIYSNSIDTGNEQRDEHLKSADFLNTRQYPVIGFHSRSVKQHNTQLVIEGTISLMDLQQEQTIHAKYLGTTADPMGNTKACFSLDLVLNRRDFNITWNQTFDTNGILVSDEVRMHADIQLLKLTQPS